MNNRRCSVLRFAYQLCHRPTFPSECKYCSNFSIILTVPENGIRKVPALKEENSVPCGNENVLNSFTDKLWKKQSHKLELLAEKMKREKYPSTDTVEQQYQQTERHICKKNTFKLKTPSRNENFSPEIIRSYFIECQKTKLLPGMNIISFLLQLCARHGDKENIMFAKDVIKLLDPKEYEKQGSFDQYLAEVFWRCGHFEDALILFWNVYEDNILLRNKIKIVLKVLMIDAISSKGEAVLILITNFSKKCVDTYSDYSFLSLVWECCFLSDWHSDNSFASSILEEYPQLKNNISLQVHSITSRALNSHKIEIVQRLFEVLLKYDMKIHYELVLRSLFDYACSKRDLYACSSIIQSSRDLDVTLTEEQSTRFLQLFCQQNETHASKLPVKTWKTKPSKFTFKF